jgi:hypothetical protein
MEPESHAVDGGEVDLGVQGSGRLEQTPNSFNTEDGGKAVCGVRPHQRQSVPITLEDVLIEKAEATVAEAHGRWCKAIDVCAVQAVVLKLLFGEHVGRCARELRQQAYCSDIGLRSSRAFATAWERGNHLLTQWGHERSPFVS